MNTCTCVSYKAENFVAHGNYFRYNGYLKNVQDCHSFFNSNIMQEASSLTM